MWIYHLDPVLAHLGPLEIRWYGLVYVIGFLLSVWSLFLASKKRKINLSKDGIWDLTFYVMIGVLIGSRIFMIFWNPDTYLLHPLNLIKFWEGGMSFHGGLLGSVLAAWVYCQKKKINFWIIADILSLPAIFALALGRIANFINGELIGRVWNGKWCVVFPAYGPECRHPNMIYSAVERMIVFSGLWFLSIKDHFTPGFIFWNLIFWEGMGRIIMDYFREDLLYYGWSLGQWFSLMMVISALFVFFKKYGEDWKRLMGLKERI